MANKKKSEMTPEELKWDEHVDKLVDIMKGIPLHQVTILTGSNGSGKSMIRKLLRQFLRDRDELKDKKWRISSTSMDDRAGVNPERMMVFDRDCEWLPTGENTLHNVTNILDQPENCFIILDEIELGMGEELQMGIAEYINSRIPELLEKSLGILVISHSRVFVKAVTHDKFINIDGMTEEEWVNRIPVPVSVEEFKKNSNSLYQAFQNRLVSRG